MAVKAIIFDFWGTLVENGVEPSPIRQAKFILWLKMPFQEFVEKFERVFMTKKYESLMQAFEAVCNEFQISVKDYQIEKCVGMWNKNRLLAKPFEEAIPVLEELKKKYKLVLLSNTDGFSVEPILEKFGMKKYFDEISLSYETGLLKTDVQSFDSILEKLNLKKEEVVMVGDSMESDILSAQKAGIRGILVDRRAMREYGDKIKNLTELKEKI